MNPTITISESGDSSFIREAIKMLSDAKVYVGIPESDSARRSDSISNAALLFIHSNGSELMHIPARPVIEPAIEDAKDIISDTFGKAAVASLDGNNNEFQRLCKIAGTQGAAASKRWFTNSKNGWPRNKEATIRRKLRRLRGNNKSKALDILNKAGEAGDVSSIDTPLIDTGELRRSITHVEQFK